MTARSARRQEQLELAASLRSQGTPWTTIAATLRDRYGLGSLVAMRLAHGWGQADAAAAWTAMWPDDPKSFKNFSSWENWPSPTGHAPSLAVLDRLARLYECDAVDLLHGWGEHRPDGNPAARVGASAGSDALAWQVGRLGLDDLSHAIEHWAERLPATHRRAMLLKLSTAAATAAGRSSSLPPAALGTAPSSAELVGLWERAATRSSARAGTKSTKDGTEYDCTPRAGG